MKTKIIAEMASCHNGDLELGKKLVHAAANVGVDIVKFQAWQGKNVPADDPDKKRYDALELSDEDIKALQAECHAVGVEFLLTCFDVERIPFLQSLGMKRVKVASFDLKNEALLRALRASFDEVIVSTGQSTVEEIQNAVRILETGDYTLMHCVSIYPTPYEKANMQKLAWLRQFTSEVGYSDHVMGPDACMLAIARGAKYVEHHFTIDRAMEQMSHTTLDDPNARPMTTHEMADEPPVFAQIAAFRDAVALMDGPLQLELQPEEVLHRRKYTGRLDGTKAVKKP